ncbi:P-loop containing nucleoside triphosphate hydrolase protein [Panaeolus papilionaceus]|nr:P-loop containing nucleoside triphosphate hydrolase protein [Panaeolus papilionaceus]
MTYEPTGFEFTEFMGKVSIEPNNVTPPPYSFRYLIMGPTGAGKSSFIQALAGDSHNLSITKDQLVGYTQQVTSYKVEGFVYRNASGTYPIYLVDTPGFSNADISEWELMVMVRRWLEYTNKSYWMNGILYFTPITDTRLRGSQQRTVEMLREFLNPIYPGNFLCLTTMWDTLSNERMKQRAEYNFAQLRDGVFKTFGRGSGTKKSGCGSRVTKLRDS